MHSVIDVLKLIKPSSIRY